ncbi:hypothetical protein PVAP13_4NG290138 [Panicum virgatum]|uniref:E2 ubiquitin-conjugating enzyme n=1 Tax=Panicum virgatum TaxID=38727 RepID=A0A8T0TJ80_PANVG|nr:hypothetical protein PVAP13_4NG290138 [Panicum virgatum]
MATLSKEIGLDAPKAILPSGAGTSSRAEASQLEKENFDTEATTRGENQESQTGDVPAAASGPKPTGAEGQSVMRRLQSELMALMMGGDPGVSAFPGADRTIAGSAGIAYAGTSYRLALAFTAEYPYKPPTVRFGTPCFHPNVDARGSICLDVIQDKWSSAYDVRTILLSIQSLLGEPNNDSPLNTQAAALWANQEEFRKMVEKLYKPTV